MNTGLIEHTKATEMANVYARNTAAIVDHLREITRLHSELGSVFFGTGAFNFEGCSWNEKEFHNLNREFKRDGWRELVEKLELRKYMCSSDQEDLDKALRRERQTHRYGDYRDPIDDWPEITPESIIDVMSGYVVAAPDFLDKSIREEWNFWLPRRDTYVTNRERWKVSEKIIMQRFMRGWCQFWSGHSINYGNEKHVTNLDNIFHLLDGKGFTREGSGPLYNAIQGCDGTFDTDYFRGRCFRNGNLHIWIKREDLLDKFNEIGCGEGSTGLPNPPGSVDAGSPLDEKPPKSIGFDFFETPKAVVKQMIHIIDDHLGAERDVSRCGKYDNTSWRKFKVKALEPSAGDGAIATELAERGCDHLYCIELDRDRANRLDKQNRFHGCECGDFMAKEPFPVMDVVAMNSPFSNHRDVFHVRRGFDFLAWDGILVAVMSPAWQSNADKYSKAFREWIENIDHEWLPLPRGAFKESGTMVGSGLLVIRRGSRPESVGIGSNSSSPLPLGRIK